MEDVNHEIYGGLYDQKIFGVSFKYFHCGFPLWGTWGNPAAEQWIRDRKYEAPEFGNHTRPSWGDYAQDSIPLFEQKTIEGHAVRATLFATGATSAALENRSPEYIAAVSRLWDNMIGKRMFITGGVGAVHFDEKFGPDYFLPTDAPNAFLQTYRKHRLPLLSAKDSIWVSRMYLLFSLGLLPETEYRSSLYQTALPSNFRLQSLQVVPET